MAKILQGTGIEQISGTIGGTTYQNWRGMIIARGKPTPTNPNTMRQTEIRSIITSLSRRWRDVLNEGLRHAWKEKAKNFPWYDVFGREIRMSGINLYIKSNLVLLDHGLTVNDTPPPDIVPPELTDITLTDEEGVLQLQATGLDQSVINSQSPFIDVWVAGGVYEIEDYGFSPENQVILHTYALSAGRTAQKSDFRHAGYWDDFELPADPSFVAKLILKSAPDGAVKNFVVSIKRYNKYGVPSAPRIYSGVRTVIAG